ncbi:unnamed protein product [Vitrella brassicaformis CCMP3155]|uniref:Uncharacterized protein n=1 Tax=Vitrella brassicaformis (strain CCMP3155) TaxID=1169540 RepID=A0A0G4E8B3_VITBC|nr:unnamed protein product [Vitrella brassicaformis CCMP3155]|eukprot:CEL91907.1 unnamed protein product [Vitrella brassicaformis CCMP3155]
MLLRGTGKTDRCHRSDLSLGFVQRRVLHETTIGRQKLGRTHTYCSYGPSYHTITEIPENKLAMCSTGMFEWKRRGKTTILTAPLVGGRVLPNQPRIDGVLEDQTTRLELQWAPESIQTGWHKKLTNLRAELPETKSKIDLVYHGKIPHGGAEVQGAQAVGLAHTTVRLTVIPMDHITDLDDKIAVTIGSIVTIQEGGAMPPLPREVWTHQDALQIALRVVTTVYGSHASLRFHDWRVAEGMVVGQVFTMRTDHRGNEGPESYKTPEKREEIERRGRITTVVYNFETEQGGSEQRGAHITFQRIAIFAAYDTRRDEPTSGLTEEQELNSLAHIDLIQGRATTMGTHPAPTTATQTGAEPTNNTNPALGTATETDVATAAAAATIPTLRSPLKRPLPPPGETDETEDGERRQKARSEVQQQQQQQQQQGVVPMYLYMPWTGVIGVDGTGMGVAGGEDMNTTTHNHQAPPGQHAPTPAAAQQWWGGYPPYAFYGMPPGATIEARRPSRPPHPPSNGQPSLSRSPGTGGGGADGGGSGLCEEEEGAAADDRHKPGGRPGQRCDRRG